ncbi:Hypothetical protein ORPV_275 [Orpheovirus IHUMI-LCC2]|uniref:Uncharacterized protein n=1 Tax=Orpheovirus IHUMI-LCC2 TaxID=2023057 RepID=A0A2I2L3Y8_9VIRU|nr:Hypothetical protein ORPV_275 [Orpheovirus IHUMI-LCC2]SNW62179.1 Hypothetical protein ORPV_275 [Orpheovirus IHUMI-LCC2]
MEEINLENFGVTKTFIDDCWIYTYNDEEYDDLKSLQFQITKDINNGQEVRAKAHNKLDMSLRDLILTEKYENKCEDENEDENRYKDASKGLIYKMLLDGTLNNTLYDILYDDDDVLLNMILSKMNL